MLICSRTGRVLRPGESMRVLTGAGFPEGVYDGTSLTGGVRVAAGARVHQVAVEPAETPTRASRRSSRRSETPSLRVS